VCVCVGGLVGGCVGYGCVGGVCGLCVGGCVGGVYDVYVWIGVRCDV
jgi:hypothetical protein